MNISDHDLTMMRPHHEWEEEFASMLREYRGAGDSWFDYEAQAYERGFESYIKWLHNSENGVAEDGSVPCTTRWLVRNRTILGVSSIRHFLTPYLFLQSGHIGYTIRPSQRQKGLGTFILSATLEDAKLLNLEKVLLVCEEENRASARVIENNGGYAEVEDTPDERLTMRRYWIDLIGWNRLEK